MREPSALVAVIELLLQYHCKALRILTGEYEPTLLELSEIVTAATEKEERTGGSTNKLPYSRQLADIVRGEEIQRIVDDAGGWKHLAKAVRHYEECFPVTWGIFTDHVLRIIPGGASRIESRGQAERIADKYGVCAATISEKRKTVPEAIAKYAEMMPRTREETLEE